MIYAASCFNLETSELCVSLCLCVFSGHAQVNSSTGALIITGLTREHSGVYKAEINNKVVEESKSELLVICKWTSFVFTAEVKSSVSFFVPFPSARVSKPTVSTSCNGEKMPCVFTCEANTTGAEPVSYSWMSGGKNMTEETNTVTITKV